MARIRCLRPKPGTFGRDNAGHVGIVDPNPAMRG